MGESLISLDRATVLPPILLLCLACYICVVPVTEAIWLQIPSSGTKCVSEEINSNVVVLADYYVIDEAHPEHPPTVSAKVTSPYGNNLHHNENVTHGQFAFTTTEAGNYMACFWLGSNPQKVADATLGLDWRIGFSAKDWESVAKKDKIEASSLNYSFLLKLESGLRFLQISV
ncbi:GOLD domain-containing protein [Citrus sinensis]|uniref:GOLD domain-containing protein n=1 Tax=Citrus sinensis TaxID=2711 RepID=A0ACB8KRG1_CITSI|nr:GOLD domain-containing protein [Citrus sinensis]